LNSEQEIQAEQLTRHRDWIEREGVHHEYPVTEETYREPAQVERTKWLVENTRDVPMLLNGQEDIMELGVSNAHQLLAVNGHVGVDLSPDIIRQNHTAHPDRDWIIANIASVPILLSLPRTHTVMVPDVLEHLDFMEALKVVAGCKELAKNRILITIPDGRVKGKNVREVECMKHRFVLSEQKLEQLLSACRGDGWKVTLWETVGPFVCIRMEVSK